MILASNHILTTINPAFRRTRTHAMAIMGLLWVLCGCGPPGPRALLEGEQYLKAGKPNDAIRRLRSAVEYLPKNPQAWNHLGLAYHAAGQPVPAAQAYQQAIQLNPNLPSPRHNLGILLLEQGNARMAIDPLRSFVALQPRSAEGWRRLGQAYLRNGQWQAAEQSLNMALRLNPNDPETFNALGLALHQQSRPRDAWQCFSGALRVSPRFAPAWWNLAATAQQANARPQALQAYRTYASLRPDRAHSQGLNALIHDLAAPPPAPLPEVQSLPPEATATLASPVAQSVADTRPRTLAPESEIRSQQQPSSNIRETLKPVATQEPLLERVRPAEQREPLHIPDQTAPPALLTQNQEAASRPTNLATPVPETPSRLAPVPAPTQTTAVVATRTEPQPRPPTFTNALTVANLQTGRVLTNRIPVLAASTTSQPRSNESSPSSSVASESLPPLVRPVSERRPPESSEGGGFWRWANPTTWFRDNTNSASSAERSPRGTARPESSPSAGGNAPLTVASAARTPASVPTGNQRPAASAPLPAKQYQYRQLNPPAAGNWAAAKPLLEQALQEHRRGRLDTAIQLYQSALRQDPASGDAYQNLAAAYLQRGEIQNALNFGELAVVLRPDSPPARLNFALALERGEYYQDAASEAEALVASHPNDVRGHLLLGNLYARHLGAPARAREHYLKVIELEPGHPQSVPIRDWLAGRR